MSFTVCYEPSSSSSWFSLTAIVGKDGSIYWLTKFVASVFHDPAFIHPYQVSDVTGLEGCSPAVHCELLQEQVISHIELCKMFKKTKNSVLKKFGKKLNDKHTLVECVAEESSTC